LFILPEGADNTERSMAESKDPMEAQPNIGTPEHPRNNNVGPLVDTPSSPKRDKAASKAKRLRKNAFSQGKDTGNLSKEEPAFKNTDARASSGRGSGDDLWTMEEEQQEEYGHQRRLLKQHGVQKKHIKNMETVKHNYPGLELMIDFLSTRKCTVEQVAEAIRGVPFWDPKGLMEKESKCVWLHEQILCLPERIPEECQY
jgi:hypothetical protein